MKYVFLIIYLIKFGDVNAQTTTLLTYDTNGNRIKKQIVGSTPHPTVTASPDAVNPNQPCVLTASGCNGTVQWVQNGQTGNSITVTPSTTTQYEARCIANGCASYGFAKTLVTVISCTNVPLTTASYPENTVKYGQNMTLFAFGCNGYGTVSWSSGNVGSPTNVTIYGSSTIYTATCQTQYCPNLGSSTIIVGGISGCLTGDVLITKQDGSWNDVNTWACGRLPTSNDEVFINHQVTIYGISGYAKSIIKGNYGTLIYDNLGTIYVPQN